MGDEIFKVMKQIDPDKNKQKAIDILIAVAVCCRPILGCDDCPRYCGEGQKCKFPTDRDIEWAVKFLQKGG